MAYSSLRKIAFVGDYPPRKCGIATFTHDLSSAVAQHASSECIIVPVDYLADGYDYPPEVRFQIAEQDLFLLATSDCDTLDRLERRIRAVAQLG